MNKDIETFDIKENSPEAELCFEIDNAFCFNLGGKTLIKVTDKGDFYVREKMVANDIEVYEAFKTWLEYVSNGIGAKDEEKTL